MIVPPQNCRNYLILINWVAEAYMAGFSNPHHYRLRRAAVPVPLDLVKMLFPGWKRYNFLAPFKSNYKLAIAQYIVSR